MKTLGVLLLLAMAFPLAATKLKKEKTFAPATVKAVQAAPAQRQHR